MTSYYFTLVVGETRKVVSVDNSHFNYTEFQINRLKEIQAMKAFEYFDMHEHEVSGKPHLTGSVFVRWHTKDGKSHSQVLGPRKVIN